MKTVQKISVPIQAWRLGGGSETEARLIVEKKIVLRDDGTYELFSTEAQSKQGQIARAGDYFKVDLYNGLPYPNAREFFESRHTPIGPDTYLQNNPILPAWVADDPTCPEIEFLLSTGRLTIAEEDPEHYFQAFLWGAPLSAAKDAVVVFYQVIREPSGQIKDIEFNFIARNEFEITYQWIG